MPCKYILQKIYKLTKLSLDIFFKKFKEIDLKPPNLFFIPKICNVCTKFKNDLVIFKKKQWCLKCFFKLKKEEGIVYVSFPFSSFSLFSQSENEKRNKNKEKAFYFKNGLNPFVCEKCWAYPIMIHICEICNYRICSICYDSSFFSHSFFSHPFFLQSKKKGEKEENEKQPFFDLSFLRSKNEKKNGIRCSHKPSQFLKLKN